MLELGVTCEGPTRPSGLRHCVVLWECSRRNRRIRKPGESRSRREYARGACRVYVQPAHSLSVACSLGRSWPHCLCLPLKSLLSPTTLPYATCWPRSGSFRELPEVMCPSARTTHLTNLYHNCEETLLHHHPRPLRRSQDPGAGGAKKASRLYRPARSSWPLPANKK